MKTPLEFVREIGLALPSVGAQLIEARDREVTVKALCEAARVLEQLSYSASASIVCGMADRAEKGES